MVISVNRLSSTNLDKYDNIDSALIPSKDFIRNYGDVNDYIEAHLYTKDDRLITSRYNIIDYITPSDYLPGVNNVLNSLELFPEKFITDSGFYTGTFKVQYNIYRKKISSITDKVFFIKQISSDRTEIRLSSNSILDNDIEEGVLNFLYEKQSTAYFKDFLLNFGDNKIVNAVNIALDKTTIPYSILIKLYQPLPAEFSEKSSLWIVEELADPYVFEVELGIENIPDIIPTLRPANFDIQHVDNIIRSSDYININGLYNTNSTSSFQKILNRLDNESIELSIDYSNYSNFIHFSSAQERLSNFVYKLGQIEAYSTGIQKLSSVPSQSLSVSVSSSLYTLQNNLNSIIQKFDGYEKYLYYVSGSHSWPKSGSYPNYYLYPTTSSIALSWIGTSDSNSPLYGGQMNSASIYDNENQDNLIFSVPEFISVDPNSESYLLFLNMIGQHFDNIWIYIKSITDINKNSNSFTDGISKDLVFNALRSLGIKLYNDNSNQNIFEYLLGATISGSYAPVTSSFYTTVSSSAYSISGEDISKEYFKRIYHNLPYLLKSKGTSRGIKALISSFGIPDTILDVTEYGGSDKFNDTLEYIYDRFAYALSNTNQSSLKTSWTLLRYNRTNSDRFLINPDAIEFRIKPDVKNVKSSVTLLQKTIGTSSQMGIVMNYTSSNSIPSANIMLVVSGSTGNISSSLTLPMYITGSNGDSLWWNFMVRRRNANITNDNTIGQYYDIFVKDSISSRIGHQGSSSLYITDPSYNNAWNSMGTTSSAAYFYIGGPSVISGPFISGSNFVGNIQEVRVWTENLSEQAFNAHVLNPLSIEGNVSSSAFEFLSARYPLGNDLITYNNAVTQSVYSVHPKYGNAYVHTLPFEYQYGYDSLTSASYHYITSADAAVLSGSANLVNFISYISGSYTGYSEIYSTNVPNSGYYGAVNDKIRISTKTISGSVLSPILRQEPIDEYRTKDIHFVDVSFSPQSQIDKDIVEHYGGSINIDNLIGDPGDNSKIGYPALLKLKDEYFSKYVGKFNYRDFIRLISYFDNSLFKMIEDYTPARSNLSTGITIKPTILDRSKIKRCEPNINTDYEELSSHTGGVVVSSDSTYTSGYSDGRDFYNGEVSGSVYDFHKNFIRKNVNPYRLYSSSFNQNSFEHSTFNVLVNNVSESAESKVFSEIDRYNTTVSKPAHVQDSNYTSARHILPRYVGSKTDSTYYNTYIPGDTSYGKTAAIDKNVSKFAFINQFNPVNVNFYDKATANIKYLIDASGSVIELSRQNHNIFEIQNSFKSGDSVDVALMDPFNPSNQTDIEGSKQIWEGGFSFSPILFREINEPLMFDYIVPTSFVSSKLGIRAVMTSSMIWDTGFQYTPDISDGSGVNDYPRFNINGVRQTGQKLSLYHGNSIYASDWLYQKQIPVQVKGPFINDSLTTPDTPGWTEVDGDARWFSIDCFAANATGSAFGGYGTVDFINGVTNVNTGGDRYTYYTVPRNSEYIINLNVPIQIIANNGRIGQSVCKLVTVVEKKVNSVWSYVTHSKLHAVSVPSPNFAINTDESSIWNDGYTPNSPLRVDCYVDNFKISLNQGDQVRAKIYVVEQRDFFTRMDSLMFEVLPGDANTGYFEIYDNVSSATIPITSTIVSSDSSGNPFFSSSDYNVISFNASASLLYNNTRFNVSGSFEAGRYSTVYHNFEFKVGDYIRFGTFFQYTNDLYIVTKVVEPIIYTAGGNAIVKSALQLVLDRPVSPSTVTSQRFAILRKKPDETSIILSYNKSEGMASSGILIPYNLKPVIKTNVANIIAPLKDTLLSRVLVI